MKKLKLKGTLLQHAEKLTRDQQKTILGGYGGGGGGGGTPCYSVTCYNQNHVILGRVNESPQVCGYDLNYDMQKCVQAGYGLTWGTWCCV